MKRALAILLVLLLGAGDTLVAYTSIIVDEGFTNAGVTCTSVQAGAWSATATWSCGREPLSTDWVQINHAVTITGTRNAWTVYVAAGGSLTCTAPMTLTFSNTAYEATTQFYTGLLVLGTFTCVGTSKTPWARTTAGIASGATTMTVDACTNWAMGDRLLIPDTRERDDHTVDTFVPEVVTISSMASCAITFSPATTHAYTTARDHAGVVERLIPIANLTRDIVFKSASAGGTRAHMLFDAPSTIDLEYVSVQDMGRTTVAVVDATTNHIGRYATHLHHTVANAVYTGNVVEGYKKWGLTVHDSSDNTVTYNVAYNGFGWGFGTEAGTEINNLIDHNFCDLVSGGGAFDNGATHTGGRGANGSCFWFEASRNTVTYNVASNSENTGFSVWANNHAGETMGTFAYNESIANTVGYTWWDPSNLGDVADHLYEWHSTEQGFYGYGVESTFNDFYSRGDPSRVGARTFTHFDWFGDYDARGAVFLRANVQNKDVGFWMPYGTASGIFGDVTVVRGATFTDAYMYNTTDFRVQHNGQAGGSTPSLGLVINPTHGNAAGTHYEKIYTGAADVARLQRLVVQRYNGASTGFEVYAPEQAGSHAIPYGDDGQANYNCPGMGLTNDLCWAAYTRAIYGEVLPATAHTRANVNGLVVDEVGAVKLRVRFRGL